MRDTVTAIDAGTTKLTVLILNRVNGEKMELSGLGKAGYVGVHNEGWKSREAMHRSLDAALRKAVKMSGVRVTDCTLGIPNEFCGLAENNKELRLDRTVTRKDINQLDKLVAVYPLPHPWKVLDVIKGNYLTDGSPVGNPLGVNCHTLSLQASVICVDTDFANQFTQALHRLQLNVTKWVPAPLACGETMLTREERKAGTIWIDTGGESTDVVFYQNGLPVFLDWLPIGGNTITRDIATGIGVTFEEAEKLKRFCVLGIALREDPEASEMNLPIRDGKQIHNVPMDFLQQIVEARIDEILELIQSRMEAQGLTENPHNAVLAGGGLALFRGVREFVGQKWRATVRLGVPDVIGLSGPTFSTVYAVGYKGFSSISRNITPAKIFKAMLGKLRFLK